MSTSTARPRKIHYAWIIMIACCFIQAGQLGIIQNCSGVFLQPVADSIGCGRGDLSIYMTIQAYALALTMPLVGRWLPTKNINVLMTVAAVLDGGGMMLMSQFTEPWMWWVDAVVIGVGSAFLFFAPIPILIQNWFAKKTGLAMGIATACSGVGAAIFTPILSTLITSVGWQASYLLAGGMSLLLTVPFTAFVLRFKPADMGMTPYGAEAGETVKHASAMAATGMSVKRAWATGIVVIVFIIGGFTSLSTSFTNHMTGFGAFVGFNAVTLGLLGSCNMIGNLVGKLILGPLSDKIGVRNSIIIGYAVVVVGIACVLLNGGNAILLFVGAAFYGVAFSVQTTLLPMAVRKMVGSRDYSKLYSYCTMGSAVIGSLGITICGMLFDSTGTYYTAWAFVGACLIIAFALLMFGMTYAKRVGYDDPADPAQDEASAPAKAEA